MAEGKCPAAGHVAVLKEDHAPLLLIARSPHCSSPPRGEKKTKRFGAGLSPYDLPNGRGGQPHRPRVPESSANPVRLLLPPLPGGRTGAQLSRVTCQ